MRGLVKLATLDVRDAGDEGPLEMWVNGYGELLIRAYNEGGYCFTEIPVMALLAELRRTDFKVEIHSDDTH